MKIPVLDHGYVEFVEAWGHGKDGDVTSDGDSDYEVGLIEAARQSTQGNFRGWDADPCNCDHREREAKALEEYKAEIPDLFSEPPTVDHRAECASKKKPGDFKLLSYLYKNNHATPFEFAGLVIEVQAPIFVFREWHRHRTQSYNEMSARYTPLPDLYYVPTLERVRSGAINTTNKQAQGTGMLHEGDARTFVEDELIDLYSMAEKVYQKALADGIPKELARLVMPVGHYSRMRASANLRNWLGFLTLRMDTRAQWEIRQFANAVGDIIKAKFPQTWGLFNEEHSHG